jgi:hypothetical protein
LYDVSLFAVNKDTIGYSLTDSLRWQNVVFEQWNTLSIRLNTVVPIDSNNRHWLYTNNEERKYEQEGANWRQYYRYTIDSVHQTLHLTPGNWVLHYSRADDKQVILSGVTPRHDSVYAVLNKIPKVYLLEEAAKGSGRGKKIRL